MAARMSYFLETRQDGLGKNASKSLIRHIFQSYHNNNTSRLSSYILQKTNFGSPGPLSLEAKDQPGLHLKFLPRVIPEHLAEYTLVSESVLGKEGSTG